MRVIKLKKVNKDVKIGMMAMVALLAGAAAAENRVIGVEDFRDRMMGAWLGQSAGVAFGWPTEFKCKGSLIPDGKMPKWTPGLINETFNQDDLYVEMTFLGTLVRHGLDVTTRRAGIDFANSRYRLWCANSNARNNLRNGIAAPASSHPKYHKTTDDIDYQIEADFSGIIAPGLPQAAVDLGETFGRIMNYGDGLYAGQFVGAMYAEAYFTADRVEIVERALKAIPAESRYAEMVRDMLGWYRADRTDWKGAWRKAVDKYQSKAGLGKISIPAIDVKINGAMVLLGFLFGEGDMDRTMYISTAGGYDSDCNPSSACGVLGTMQGFKRLEKRYASALSRTNKWEYTDYTWDGLVAACDELARKVVVKYGGKIVRDANGAEAFEIPVRAVKPSEFFDSRTPGPEPADAKLTPEEMKEIRYFPANQGKQSVERFEVPKTKLPALLKTADGRTVDSSALWEQVRRAEVARTILPVEYGTMPKEPVEVRVAKIGGHAAGTLPWLPGVVVHMFKVWCDMDGREVSFVIKTWTPKNTPKGKKLPVMIEGDGCWECVSLKTISAVVGRGWMFAQFNRCEVARDDHSTGDSALLKWAWSYHRAIDAILKAESCVDPERIAITGHSRGGKTTLLAAATDTRIFAVGDNCSGCGGSSPYRDAPKTAETLEAITRVFPYWFNPTWKTWAGRENELPFDQHFLVALIAPRKLYIRHAAEDLWANPPGGKLIYETARPVWALYGKERNIRYSLRAGEHNHLFEDYLEFLDFAEGR